MKILIIEDEADLGKTIKEFLEKENFIVEFAVDYYEAVDKISIYDYDCILLDITLPGGNGLLLLELLKNLGKTSGVLIISAKNSIDDKVKALNLGADDYLTKPFHLAELNARIKSLIRRRQTAGELTLSVENIVMFPDSRVVKVHNVEIELNRKEFDLLYYFMANPGRLINKTSLVEAVWGDSIDQASSFDFIYSQVKNLRKKLAAAGATVTISAVYGFGYKLSTQEIVR